jgi:hypothetical protein
MKADLMQRWHEYGLSNDELINFKDEFNKFINHARPLFTPMREINMLL